MHTRLRLPRWSLALALLCALVGAPAWPAQRALLVGVSELANQPQALWLQAPRNDVLLMRQALGRQGFAPSDITVLADGVNGAALPDAQAIHDALGRLLAQSNSGDFVLLYFSGHGTRLRDTAKRYQEPDGLAENFLARDVRGVLGTDSALAGGVRDVDMDGWIRAFLARNVFVWSVFDTCSATSMTRGAAGALAVSDGDGADEVRWRGLRPAQLRAVAAAQPAVASAAPSAAALSPVASSAAPPSPTTARARYVAFFASESHQVTPELRLPRNSRGARPQGLLTWAVAEALERRPATWRELFDGVLALYPPVIDELAQRFPTRELPSPVAEGNLDTPLFTNSPRALSTRPAWRARRSGAMLALAAGQLDGLVPGQTVRVAATLDDGAVRTALAPLTQLGLGSAQLAVPDALRDLSGAALWRVSPVDEPAVLALRVYAEGALPAGLSLEYPASIIPAASPAQADVRWRQGAGGGFEIAAPELGGPARLAPEGDPGAARRRLEALARLKWFGRLQTIAREASALPGFDAQFEVWRGDQLVRDAPAQRGDSAPPFVQPGERAALNVRNTSGQSLDLVIVGIDARGTVRAVYPGDLGETNRFEQGTREQPAAKRFTLPWFDAPGSRLLVIAAPAAGYGGPRLFGAGPDEAVADFRVRGQLRPDAERQVFAAMVRWGGGDAAVARQAGSPGVP